MPMATPVTQTASPMRLRKDNSDSIYFLSVSHAGHVPLQCPLKWQTLGSYAMPFMSAIFFLTAFSTSQIFLPLSIILLNLTSQSYTIKTAIPSFYCIISPHQSQLDINRAVETFRSRCRACRRHRCHRCGVRPTLVGRKTNALSIKVDSDGVHVNMFIQ